MKVPKPRKLPSGTWFIQLRLGGESIPVTAQTEKECVKRAEYLKAEYRAGKREKPPEKQREQTLGEAIDQYISRRDSVLSPSTIRGYKAIRKARFQGLMEKSLDSMDDADWQTACNLEARMPNCSPKTLKNAWGLVSSAIAESTGKRPPKVKLPQIMTNEHPFLSPEQILPFIKAVRGTDVEIPALLGLCSLRRSEMLALSWENVDLKNRIIKVKGAAVFDEHNKLVQKQENKNATSARQVPIMIDQLFDALKRESKETGLVITCGPNSIHDRVNRICRLNGFPLIGVHGLRHSFVSLAYHLGIREKVVMEIGGWSDFQTMRKIYTHIAKSDIVQSSKKLENFFSGKAV